MLNLSSFDCQTVVKTNYIIFLRSNQITGVIQ
jgi:hypothetical protein